MILLFFSVFSINIAIAFFKNKSMYKVFSHKCQTKHPQQIHNNIWLIVKTIKKYWPTNKDYVFHVVEKKYSYPINLSKYFQNKSYAEKSGVPSKDGVPSGILAAPSFLASCSAS